MKHMSRALWGLALLAIVATPAAAQQQKSDWSYQWYWGAHIGAFGYATNAQPTYWDPMIGAHWFITKKRVGLYTGIEQAFFTSDARSVVNNRTVTFSEVRRIMLGLVAMPKRGFLEPYLGGGFAVMYIVNPVLDCTGCSATEQAAAQTALANATTTGLAWGMAGGAYNMGNLSIFAHYMVTDAGASLIQGATHAFQGGVRYSFGRSREGIPGT